MTTQTTPYAHWAAGFVHGRPDYVECGWTAGPRMFSVLKGHANPIGGREAMARAAEVFSQASTLRTGAERVREALDALAAAPNREQPQGLSFLLTLTALEVTERSLEVGWVGGHRLLRLRQGTLTQLTRDHTLASLQAEDGIVIQSRNRALADRIVVRSFAPGEPVDLAFLAVTLEPGDRFLLHTQGLHSLLDHRFLETTLRETTDPGECVAALTSELARTGAGQNHALVVVDPL